MKLILKIDCDTAAFDTGHAGDEASRILTLAAEKVKDWPGDSTFRIGLRDSKGNRVGHLKAKECWSPMKAMTEAVETPAAPVITTAPDEHARSTPEKLPVPVEVERRGKLLTKKELAAKYRVSTRTVTNWKRWRRIPYLRIGGIFRFDEDEVSKALENLKVRARTETKKDW